MSLQMGVTQDTAFPQSLREDELRDGVLDYGA